MKNQQASNKKKQALSLVVSFFFGITVLAGAAGCDSSTAETPVSFPSDQALYLTNQDINGGRAVIYDAAFLFDTVAILDKTDTISVVAKDRKRWKVEFRKAPHQGYIGVYSVGTKIRD